MQMQKHISVYHLGAGGVGVAAFGALPLETLNIADL